MKLLDVNCIVPVKVLSRGLCLPDVAAGDNEIEQHRNFSETHFPGVAPCRFRLDGHDGDIVWDEAVPMYVTRLGDLVEKSAQKIFF